jgi:putative spermidine/putrescine transport system permease protein
VQALVTAAPAAERPQDGVVTRPIQQRRDWARLWLGVYFVIFLFFLYIPMILMAILSFQGPNGQLTFPFQGPFSLDWWRGSSTRRPSRSEDVGLREAVALSTSAGIIVAVRLHAVDGFRRRWR